MTTLMVNYDLNRPHQNYEDLIDYLKGLGPWWHHLDSTWLIKTDRTPKQVRDGCQPYLDGEDEVLVVDVGGDAAAWAGFNDRASSWLQTNI